VLTLTPTAADTVRQLLASARASAEPHAGVRISTARRGRADSSVEVTLADEPEATDQTIDEAGATVFVDETAAEFLDDKVLDASVEAKGVRFTILNPDRALGARPTSSPSATARRLHADRIGAPFRQGGGE
jgi:iron-sulfur cluster assembly protein